MTASSHEGVDANKDGVTWFSALLESYFVTLAPLVCRGCGFSDCFQS